MHSPPDDPPAESDVPPSPWPSHAEIEPRETQNLLLLAAHQIVFRSGWIFKTESVIMPAVLDQVAGAGWVRGFLPVLNRFGQSVPPVFLAEYIRALGHKKRALAAFTMLMSVPFALLSLIWFVFSTPPHEATRQDDSAWRLSISHQGAYSIWVRLGTSRSAMKSPFLTEVFMDGRPAIRWRIPAGQNGSWTRVTSGEAAEEAVFELDAGKHRLEFDSELPEFDVERLVVAAPDRGPPFGGPRRAWVTPVFLVLYLGFVVFNGLYHVSFGTVQGKLIRPTRRGQLLLTSTFWGSIPAMLLAWWLLDRWLRLPNGGFEYAFGFTAACFFLAGLAALLLFEPPDEPAGSGNHWRGNLADTARTLRADANLRCLVLVAALFGSGLIIFPHYQALARHSLGLSGVHLMIWVITQNAAVGAWSLLVGPLADRRGNRLTLRALIFGSAVAPAFAISLTRMPLGQGADLFWLVFIPLGVSPLVLRILVNYALEICAPEEHPRYLSILALGLAVPFVFSPAVGWLVDRAGFAVVFVSTAGLLLASGLATFGLKEPRHHLDRNEAVSEIVGSPE
jgi:hypothetical protein